MCYSNRFIETNDVEKKCATQIDSLKQIPTKMFLCNIKCFITNTSVGFHYKYQQFTNTKV